MNTNWHKPLSPHWGTLFSFDPQSHFLLAKVEGFLDAVESVPVRAEKSVPAEDLTEPSTAVVEVSEEAVDAAVVEEITALSRSSEEPIEPVLDEPAADGSLLNKLEEISQAAEQGNVMAQYYLGAMYATGNGEVAQDCDAAASWYTKAAEQGLAMAQNNLGFLYATGQGVPQDYVTAYMWITLAVMGDYPDAANNLNILAKYMTPELIEHAQVLAHTWQENFEVR